jgi:serine protease
LNPTFIDVDENLVTTTISNTGRIGYEDTESDTRTKGSGFVFDGNSMLYEMGVIMGTGAANMFNNVRGINSGFDQDFITVGPRVKEITPGDRSSSEIFGTLSNSSTPASQAFQMKYRSLAWKEAPYDKFVIVEYTLSNPTATAINNFYFGLFADWDITDGGAGDLAKWDNDLKMGYVYPAAASALPHGAIQLLTGTPTHFAIDNNQAVDANPFGLYDGFTDSEKFSSLSGGLGRAEAGVATNGNDVSHIVGSGPYTIPAGQEIKIAFAIHGAPNIDDLRTSAHYADTIYNYTLAAPGPVISEVSTCYGSGASLTATGAAQFKWYKTFTGGDSFFTGSNYNTVNLTNDTTFYVSNADETYESVRTAANVIVKANPSVATSGSTIICDNASVTLSAAEADSYLWSTGATTQAIEVSTPGDYTVTVASTSPVCQTTSAPLTVTTIPAPVASFAVSSEPKSLSNIQFTDQSTAAVAWYWDFGNTMTSTVQNPTTAYTAGAPYEVSLLVTASNGCQSTAVQTIDVITGLEESSARIMDVYPNPSRSSVTVDVDNTISGPLSAELITLQGQVVFRQSGITTSRFELAMGDLPDGIYVIRVAFQDKVLNRKVVKIH